MRLHGHGRLSWIQSCGLRRSRHSRPESAHVSRPECHASGTPPRRARPAATSPLVPGRVKRGAACRCRVLLMPHPRLPSRSPPAPRPPPFLGRVPRGASSGSPSRDPYRHAARAVPCGVRPVTLRVHRPSSSPRSSADSLLLPLPRRHRTGVQLKDKWRNIVKFKQFGLLPGRAAKASRYVRGGVGRVSVSTSARGV